MSNSKTGKNFIQLNRDSKTYKWFINPDNFPEVCESIILIKDKNKQIVPFILNKAQKNFYKDQTGRDVILKARQLGFTTLRVIEDFLKTILIPNTSAEVIAHTLEDTIEIFTIITLAYELLPPWLKLPTKYQNKRELVFPDINSKISVSTAGKRSGLARGSTKNHVHCSEVAFWPDGGASLPGLSETIPDSGTLCFESTSNGPGDFFHSICSAGKNKETIFKLHFYEWWWDDNYKISLDNPKIEMFKTFDNDGNFKFTKEENELVKKHNLSIEQILWRRQKISVLKSDFQREYPESFEKAFLPRDKTVFDIDKLFEYQERIEIYELSKPNFKSQYPNLDIDEIDIFEPYKDNQDYILTVDPADNVGLDYTSLYILHRNPSIGISAKLRSNKMESTELATYAYELGAIYNNPMAIIERNKGGDILTHFKKGFLINPGLSNEKRYLPYPNLYWDNGNKPGVAMTSILKNTIVKLLRDGIREMQFDIKDKQLIDEMFTFVSIREILSPTGKKTVYGASEGFQDDSLMSFGIGVFIFLEKFQDILF